MVATNNSLFILRKPGSTQFSKQRSLLQCGMISRNSNYTIDKSHCITPKVPGRYPIPLSIRRFRRFYCDKIIPIVRFFKSTMNSERFRHDITGRGSSQALLATILLKSVFPDSQLRPCPTHIGWENKRRLGSGYFHIARNCEFFRFKHTPTVFGNRYLYASCLESPPRAQAIFLQIFRKIDQCNLRHNLLQAPTMGRSNAPLYHHYHHLGIIFANACSCGSPGN